MKGRNPSSLRVENSKTTKPRRRVLSEEKSAAKEKRLPNVKYSERTGKPIEYSGGKFPNSPGKIKEATETTAREKTKKLREKQRREKFQTRKKSGAANRDRSNALASRTV